MRDLGHVQQSLFVGQDLDESAEVHDARDGALVDLADLGLCREALDDLQRPEHGIGVGAGHVHRAVVFHVDGHAGLIDDALDGLAAGSDDDADLVGLDLDGRDAGRPLVDLGAGLGQRRQHLLQDVQPAFTGLRPARARGWSARDRRS